MLASHMLTPVAVDKMPEWAKEYARGQEDAFVVQLVSGCMHVCVCVYTGNECRNGPRNMQEAKRTQLLPA